MTGGSDGIGYAICQKLALDGFNICIIARNEEKMNRKEMLNHYKHLMLEVEELKTRLQPQATGHIHTTISTLKERIEELHKKLEVD